MIWRILLLWLLVANTAYGSVPGHRPVAYGYGVDYLTSSVWRERAVDPTGLYWLGDRYYDPISSQWLSHDHSWNDRDPNGQSYCGGDPVQGTDPKGKCVQNPPPALYFGTAPVMQEYTATTRYFQNGSSIVTGLPGQPDQYFDQSQVTGYTYDRVTMPTGWDFSYVSEHPLPANYGQTSRRAITHADVAIAEGDQYIKAVATMAAFDIGGEFLLGGDALAVNGTRITGSKLWTTSEFNGIRVYQRNDLIDTALVDARGRSNLERMQRGLAPIGPDGQSINLHHTIQTADSPLAEMTATFHQDNSAVIHINPNTIPSGIDRDAFEAYRRAYWINRAKGFSP
jgi:RHS repeat-associated protein